MTIDKTIEAIEALPKDAYLQAGTDLTLRCGNNLKALAAELKELREFVGAMNPGSEICFKGVVFHLCLDGKWRSDMARSGTSGNMRYVHQGYDTALDAWRKMNAGEGE